MSELSQHLQDCILRLQIEDTEFLKQTRPVILPQYFTATVTVSICEIVYNYFDTFKQAPDDHFMEELDNFFERRKIKDQERYIDYLTKIFEIENPNKEYILTQINYFIRRSKYREFVQEFVDLAGKDKLDEMEALMYKTLKAGLPPTVRGIDYFSHRLNLVERLKESTYLMKIGIPKLDSYIGGLERKTYVIVMAPEKGLKSWMLIHLGAQALMQGLKVAHFTHEISAEKVEIRYDQNLLGLPKYRSGTYLFRYLDDETEKKDILDIRNSIYSVNHILKKRREIQRYGGGLRIVEYPTGTCSPMNLENDLDRMQNFDNFYPDVIITDYADIMESDTKESEERHRINAICKRLRGIAVERNILMLDAAQATKAAQDKKNLDMIHSSEDKRRMAICDLTLGLSATKAMREDHIIRINVIAAREVEGGKRVNIVYNLDKGQFFGYEKPWVKEEEELKEPEEKKRRLKKRDVSETE